LFIEDNQIKDNEIEKQYSILNNKLEETGEHDNMFKDELDFKMVSKAVDT